MFFISYSRRELTFVDSLSYELRQREQFFWLDYQHLTPGEEWSAQIQAAIRASSHLLLVVSQAALASSYVREEWELALAEGKLIVLLIFEAAELPPDLSTALQKHGSGWVDFRQPFETALDQLIALLEEPPLVQEIPPIIAALPPGPARLVRIGRTLARVWSLAVVLLALVTLYDDPAGALPVLVVGGGLALPLWLLPRTIRTRTFRFAPTLAVLLLCAVIVPALIAGAMIVTLVNEPDTVPWVYAAILGPGALLLAYWGWRALWLLGSEDVYRWAGPKGALVRRPGHGFWVTWAVISVTLPPFSLVYGPLAYLLTRAVIRCVSRATVKYRPEAGVSLYFVRNQRWIALDHAPQDARAAAAIRTEIEAAGHLSVPLNRADTIIFVVSTHHTTPSFDLDRALTVEGKTVIPVAIHKVPDAPQDVQALQMIELSEGLDVGTIQTLIQRIEAPQAMAGLPGVFPLSQRARPTEVQYALSGLWVWLALLTGTGIYVLARAGLDVSLAVLLVVMAGLIVWTARLVQDRHPYWYVALWSAAVLNIAAVNRVSNVHTIFALLWVSLIFVPLVLAYWITTDKTIRAWLPPIDLDALLASLPGTAPTGPLQSTRRQVVHAVDEIVTGAADFLDIDLEAGRVFDPMQVAEEAFDQCLPPTELMRLFDFNAEELALNRRGDFSRRQWLTVRREPIEWIRVALPVLVACLLLSRLLDDVHVALDVLLTTGLCIAGPVVLITAGMLISRPQVDAVAGPITRVEGREAEESPQISVNKRKLYVTSDVWGRLESPPPGVYRVYTVGAQAVSAEPYLPQRSQAVPSKGG